MRNDVKPCISNNVALFVSFTERVSYYLFAHFQCYILLAILLILSVRI